jgi:hypothetical protein
VIILVVQDEFVGDLFGGFDDLEGECRAFATECNGGDAAIGFTEGKLIVALVVIIDYDLAYIVQPEE